MPRVHQVADLRRLKINRRQLVRAYLHFFADLSGIERRIYGKHLRNRQLRILYLETLEAFFLDFDLISPHRQRRDGKESRAAAGRGANLPRANICRDDFSAGNHRPSFIKDRTLNRRGLRERKQRRARDENYH